MDLRPSYLPGVKTGDIRYERNQSKQIKSLNALPKVNVSKLKLKAYRPWISRRLSELVGIDDEVLLEFLMNTLEEKGDIIAGELQLTLEPFMGNSNAAIFVDELWKWIELGHANEEGVPEEFRKSYEAILEIENKLEEEEKKRYRVPQRRRASPHSPKRNRRRQSRTPSPPSRRRRSRSTSRTRKKINLSSPPRMIKEASREVERVPSPPQSSGYSSADEGDDELVAQLRERARRLMEDD